MSRKKQIGSNAFAIRQGSRGIVALVLVGTAWLTSCGRDGAAEMRKAVEAMNEVKSVRMVSTVPPGTWEFVCPDRIHFVENRESYEWIDIGKKYFLRSPVGWSQEPNKPDSYELGCDLFLLPLVFNRQLTKIYEYHYLGSDKVDGIACDSWAAFNKAYPRPKDGGLLEGIDYVVCINPANHLVLEMKRGSESKRFSGFNQAITIEEPEIAPAP